MKMKKVYFVRPEIEVEFTRPIIGRVYFAFIYPWLIKIKRCSVKMLLNCYDDGMAGTVGIKRFYVIAFPKVVSGNED